MTDSAAQRRLPDFAPAGRSVMPACLPAPLLPRSATTRARADDALDPRSGGASGGRRSLAHYRLGDRLPRPRLAPPGSLGARGRGSWSPPRGHRLGSSAEASATVGISGLAVLVEVGAEPGTIPEGDHAVAAALQVGVPPIAVGIDAVAVGTSCTRPSVPQRNSRRRLRRRRGGRGCARRRRGRWPRAGGLPKALPYELI